MPRRPDLVTVIAVYEFIVAAILLISACVILPFLLILSPFTVNEARDFLGGLLFIGSIIALTFGIGIGSAIVGVGLLLQREWARVGAIALAVLALFGFPIGTIIGILIIAYLLSNEARDAFRPLAARRSPSPNDTPTLALPSVEPPSPPATGATPPAAPSPPPPPSSEPPDKQPEG
mgnify:CR=1 FL=1